MLSMQIALINLEHDGVSMGLYKKTKKDSYFIM